MFEAEAAAEAPPVPLDDEYEMVDFADAEPDVAAFLTAVRANLYRPAKPPAPEPGHAVRVLRVRRSLVVRERLGGVLRVRDGRAVEAPPRDAGLPAHAVLEGLLASVGVRRVGVGVGHEVLAIAAGGNT